MNITIEISDSAIPAWENRISKASPNDALTVQEFVQALITDEEAAAVTQFKIQCREALIPVADEILAAPLAKQQAAIAAALAEVRN